MKFIAGFEEFISGNGIWIIIGCLVGALIVSFIFLILNINKAKKINKNLQTSNETEKKDEWLKVEELGNNKTELKTEKTPDKVKKETVETPFKKVSKPDENTLLKTIYSVTYDKETSEWIVKKSGATRASRRCKTEAEAIEIADKLSKNSNANITVNKKDEKSKK